MARVKFDRRKLNSHRLDNELTPAEIAELLKRGDAGELPLTIRPLLEAGETAVSYTREDWGKDARYYTANRGASGLIVAFCGRGWGVGVPISAFLQSLRDDLYDVVVLHDRQIQHFDYGVLEFSNSLLDTVQRIKDLTHGKPYSQIVTFGTSMGGYPALRAGLLLGADRAISIGGRFCWHIGRLLRGEPVGAFDPLCYCFAGHRTQMVALAAAWNDTDMDSLNVLRRTFPQCEGVTIGTHEHNIMHYFQRASLLRLLCACLFEYWHSDIRSDLLTLIERSARGNQAQDDHPLLRCQIKEFERHFEQKLDRLSQQLASLQKSRSWQITKPLRSIAGAWRRCVGWPNSS